jgi:hypothetical protein
MNSKGMFGMGSYKFRKIIGMLSLGICFSAPLFSGDAVAQQQYASRERATVARAHMSRARTLLVEALAEFEESKKYARPDMLIDSEDWRLRVISLTEQLNRVVDPQPRVTREGAVFRTPPRFIKRQKEQLPEVADGAKSRSDVGERARLKQKQQERAQFFNGVDDPTKNAGDKKGNLAKLPAELQLPDEPVLDSQSRNKGNTGPAKQVQKDLFTNELMPEVEQKGPKSKTIDSDSLVPPAPTKSVPALDTSKLKGGDALPPTEEEMEEVISSNSKSILPGKEDRNIEKELEDAEAAKKFRERQETFKSPSSELDEGMDREVKSEPSIVDDEALVESNGSDVAVVEEEVVPEEAAKRLSEDEELAKKLEDSISKSLSDRQKGR